MSEVITTSAHRPVPTPFEWDQGFWDAAAQHQLVVQCCAQCKKVRNFPRLMCPHCRSMDFGWLQASGKGRVYSWSTLYKSFHPAFVDLPITIAIVELEDFPQVHLVGVLRMEDGMTEADLCIDMPLEVVFDDVAPGIAIAQFRPVRP